MMPYMILCTINIPRTQAKLKSSSAEGELPTRLHVNPTSRLSNLAMIRVAIPRQVFGKRQEAAFSPLSQLLIKDVKNNIDMSIKATCIKIRTYRTVRDNKTNILAICFHLLVQLILFLLVLFCTHKYLKYIVRPL